MNGPEFEPGDKPAANIYPLNFPEYVAALERSAEIVALNAHDIQWLSELTDQAITEEWLVGANKTVAVGSLDLRVEPGASIRDTVVEARRKFYAEILGWDDPHHQLNHSYKTFKEYHEERFVQPSTTIESLRNLHQRGLPLAKIISQNAWVISKRSSAIDEVFDTIFDQGFDPVNLVKHNAKVLNLKPGTIKLRLQELRELRVQVEDMGPELANMLVLPTGNFKEVVTALNEKDVVMTPKDLRRLAAQLTRKSVAYLEADNVRSIVDLLNRQGLRAARIIKENPQLLAKSAEWIEDRIEDIRVSAIRLGWNGDPVRLMNEFPNVLIYGDSKIALHKEIFKRYGQPHMSVEEVGSLLKVPAESHLIALALGNEYTYKNVSSSHAMFDHVTREQLVSSIIDKSDIDKEKIAAEIIHLYQAYRQNY